MPRKAMHVVHSKKLEAMHRRAQRAEGKMLKCSAWLDSMIAYLSSDPDKHYFLLACLRSARACIPMNSNGRNLQHLTENNLCDKEIEALKAKIAELESELTVLRSKADSSVANKLYIESAQRQKALQAEGKCSVYLNGVMNAIEKICGGRNARD